MDCHACIKCSGYYLSVKCSQLIHTLDTVLSDL